VNAICKSCGSTLTPETAFCAGCGTPVAPSTEPARKNRKWPWILALILVFALGFWLGRLMAPKCPQCPAPATTGTGGDPGGGGGGGGHPGSSAGGNGDHGKGGSGSASGSGRVLGDSGRVEGSGGGGSAGSGQGTGDMVGGGTSSANGTTVGHGNDSSAVGANGSDDSGGGVPGGKSKPVDGPNGPDFDPELQENRLDKGVWQLAAGSPLSVGGGDTAQSNFKDTPTKTLTARDFRYDKTGLPRYPEANTAVSSAMSYDVPGRTDTYGSACGILTTSSFDDVVGWYRKNLPASWSDSTMSDMDQLRKQLTPDKIMQMIAAPNGGTPEKSAGDVPATAAADRQRLSLFSPPAGTKGDVGIMIVQKGDNPVTVLMKAHISP